MNKPFEVVSDLVALHAIPKNYRYEGMEVLVANTYTNGVKQKFTLSSGITNAAWVEGNVGGTPGGDGGGASLLDWDLTPVVGAATHEVNPFPPEVPIPNDAVIVGDAMTLTIPAATQVYASSRLSASFGAGDKKYFYVRPYAATGAASLEEYSLILGDGNVTATPVAQFGFSVDGGITLSSTQLGAPVAIDPAFSLGDVFLVYVDMVAGTVGVKTAAVDTTENIVCPAGTLAFNLIGSGSDGAGVAQMDLAGTDLGSGITAPVGYTALSGDVPAGLPVGAVDGDHLKVTVGGTYNSVTYAVDDLAVVLDAGTGAVFPVGEKSVPVPEATWVETYSVTVGAGGLFPDFQALMLDIEDNKRQGDTLGITFTGTALTANDKLLRVPSFKKITLKVPAPMTPPADPNFIFTLDGLANEYIELQGEIQAPYINGFNVLLVPLDLTGQTGLYAWERYNLNGVYGEKVTAGDPYPYIRCGTAIGAVLRDVGYVRGIASGYSTESKLEIGFTTANTGVTFLFGNIGGLIKTNRPISLVNASFNIATLENISLSNITSPLVTAVGGSYGRIIDIKCGTAGLSTVLTAEYAAVHVHNITGTYTNLTYAGRRVNVFTKEGGIFYNGLPDGTVQCIPIACSDETTALTAGTGKVTFRMPYAFTLQEVRASLSTAQTSGSIFTIDVNEAGASVFSTALTIDNTEKTSTTAATPAVISDIALADDAEITIDIDQIGDGTAKGLKVYLIGVKA